MKNKILAIIIVGVATSLFFADKICSNKKISLIAKSNVEALTVGETDYFRVNNRTQSQCSIYVGAKGKIKLLSGVIIEANASGYVNFDGQVVCSGNGDVLCKPVECIDIYETIL